MEEYNRTIAAMTANLPDPMEEYNRTIAAMNVNIPDPMEEYNRTIAAMTANLPDPMEEYNRTIASITKLIQPDNNYKKVLSSSNVINNIAKDPFFSSFKNVASEVNDEVYVDENGNVSLSTANILVGELQNISNEIINRSAENISRSIEESFNNLIIEIQKQKDPLLQKLLMWFIYPLLVGMIIALFNPVADKFVRSNFNQTKKEIAKELKINVRSSVRKDELLKVMKYVSAGVLNVRVDSSTKSDLVGQLQFSSVVLIIEKRKNWTLVQWSNPKTNTSIQGWVFSRYLKSFK
ncbi:MAG: SH3 domain-containing protein, partial [Colwellia sp.]